jgi:predicted transcriptional regulator
MTTLSRREIADGVLAHLRACGPQTVAEIKTELGLTKREVEAAIYLLMNQSRIEYDYPSRSPLSYVARTTS